MIPSGVRRDERRNRKSLEAVTAELPQVGPVHGGGNDFDDVAIMKNEPYHMAITTYQNELTRWMRRSWAR